jgi:hypothetical protein
MPESQQQATIPKAIRIRALNVAAVPLSSARGRGDMITLFECWNGGMVQWDRITPPQFAFAFPAASPELVTFFQLSGRIGEVLTGAEWLLNIGGQLFDIPNFPPDEVNTFAQGVRASMGYACIPVPFQLGNIFSGFVTIPVALWVNLQTGRADMFNPMTGPVLGQQLLQPQMQGWPGQGAKAFASFPATMPTLSAPGSIPQLGPAPAGGIAVNLTAKGEVHGGGAKNTLESIAKIAEGVGQIANFLSGILPRSGSGNGA